MMSRKKGIDNIRAELNHGRDYDGYAISPRAIPCSIDELLYANLSGRVHLLDRLL